MTKKKLNWSIAATKEVEEVDEINHFLLRKNAEMLDRLIDLND